MVQEDDKQEEVKKIGVFITIPFVLAVPPVMGWLIGSWLDKKLDTHPYLMYVLMLLGFIAGFRELYRILKRFGNGS